MKKIEIRRFYSDINNTLGCMTIEGLNHPIFTNELAWKFNQKEISCIPEGCYIVKPHHSEKFGNCFKVLDVPNRSDILIHVGNTEKDTKGCILVGLQCGTLRDEEAVLSSRIARNLLVDSITEKCLLKIVNAY